VLAYERVNGEDSRVVLINFANEPRTLDAKGTVEVSSVGVGEGRSFGGTLAPDEAIVLS
jgi:hypothetical protein